MPVIGQFPAVFSLANLNGQNGFKLDGEATDDWSGSSVSSAGDINGDGLEDLIIGSPWHNSFTGRSYVVYGGSGVGSNGLISLSSLNGTNGFKLDGEATGDRSGGSVSSAGDINGDGYEDFLIGAINHPCPSYPAGNCGPGPGRGYVVFGGLSVGSSGLFPLSSLNGTNGFKLDGEAAGDGSGGSLSSAGDINGDGLMDLLIGAPYHNATGRSYVVFGGLSVGSSGLFPLSSLNGTNGFKLDGEAWDDFSGSSVSSAGDINGDGLADLLIGAPAHNSHTGRSYVLLGGAGIGSGGVIAFSNLNGTNGFKLDGEATGDQSGTSVSSAGDINGDGYADILIGAPQCYNGFCASPGRSYVVLGRAGVGGGGLLSLSSLNGINGFKLDGEVGNDHSGLSVSSAGDINGDGYADVLLGAMDHDNSAGRSYVLLGGARVGNGGGLLSLSSLNGTNGFKLDGEVGGEYSALSVSSVGDINGDGLEDLIIGAPWYNGRTGRSYVVFGDLPPVLVNNSLTIVQNATAIFSNSNLAAYDLNHQNSSLIFSPSNVMHGQFELINNPGVAIFNFTQQQVTSHAVQFVHDGGFQAPSYNISVNSSGIAYVPPSPANISFTFLPYTPFPPVLVNNYLFAMQNRATIVNETDLLATDLDPRVGPGQLTFLISGLQHGQFSLVSTPATAITQFTQTQVNAGQIQFIDNGDSVAPSYFVSVINGVFSTPLQAVNAKLDLAPIFLANQFIISQGQTIQLDTTEIAATDEHANASQLVFNAQGIVHGHFFSKQTSGLAITQFTQDAINNGEIEFTQDGSDQPPAYALTVTDNLGLSTGPLNANITFIATQTPTTPSGSTSSNTVRNAIIGAAISGVAGLGFLFLKIWINRKADQYFEKATQQKEGILKQQAEFQRNIIQPIAKKIFASVNFKGFMGYINDRTMQDAIDVITSLVHELQSQGVNVDLNTMSVIEQNRLLNTIGRQARKILAPEAACCSATQFARFFCPETTPRQMEDKTTEIATAVKGVLAKASVTSSGSPISPADTELTAISDPTETPATEAQTYSM